MAGELGLFRSRLVAGPGIDFAGLLLAILHIDGIIIPCPPIVETKRTICTQQACDGEHTQQLCKHCRKAVHTARQMLETVETNAFYWHAVGSAG
jgi:hypothetical protein